MTTKSLGGRRFVVLDKRDLIIHCKSVDEALSLLRPMQANPLQIEAIRRLVASLSSRSAKPLPAEVSLRQLASLLISGRVKIIRTQPVARNGGGDDHKDKTAHEESTSRAAHKNSWIEIYLRDKNGKPLAGEKYRIKLPDASIEEGVLDAHGHAEYYGINPGMCEVSFPNIPDEKWDLA